MTFSDALDRLPACSYAVERDGGIVNVWFLYRQDPEELGDPMAESDPWVDVWGANVVRWGEEFGGNRVMDGMAVEDAPERVRKWEWTPTERGWEWKWTPTNRDGLSPVADPSTLVHVLRGMPVDEAKELEEWPEEIRALTR